MRLFDCKILNGIKNYLDVNKDVCCKQRPISNGEAWSVFNASSRR